MKKFLYTIFTTVLFTTTAFSQGEQRYANGSAIDQDGSTFEWINYGTQDWAIENAEVVTYRDGTAIPQVSDATEWSNLTTGAWSYYDNDSTKGRLYNWYAVMGIHDTDPNTPNKEFAPEGWHVPTYDEWTTLENQLIANGYNYDGTTQDNKIAKSMASTTGWNSSTHIGAPGNDQSLNNNCGFNALPEGYGIGLFGDEGHHAVFWSSAESNTDSAWNFNLVSNDSSLNNNDHNKKNGNSVRFVRDASSFGAYGNILLNGIVSAENNQIKNVADPTEAQDVTTKSYVDNSVSNTYTQAEVDAIVSSLQSQIDALKPTSVTDQDGNTYEYLTYGDHVWPVKNAEVLTYRDGTEIPQVTDATEWNNLTTGAWCYFDNDPTKGKLYNWYAVAGIHDSDPNTPNKELAPEGWRIPSDAEWTTLENHLIANGYNYDGTFTENKIAKAMASTTEWISCPFPGTVGNDESLNNSSGFNAFPEGFYSFSSGSFYYEGSVAVFWSSTENGPPDAWSRFLFFDYSGLYRSGNKRQDGFSVRFIKDN